MTGRWRSTSMWEPSTEAASESVGVGGGETSPSRVSVT